MQQRIKTKKSFDGVIPKRRVALFVEKLPPKTTSYLGRKASLVFTAVSLLSLSLSSFVSLGSTIAYYRDTEKSTENRVEAGTLGLSIGEPTLLARVSLASTEDIEVPKDNVGSYQFDVNVAPSGSLPLEYKVSGKMDEGNPGGCEETLLSVDFPGHTYEGLVQSFTSLVTGDLGEWHFMASLPVSSSVAMGAVCSGTITFEANLKDVNPEVKNTWTDKKVYSFSVKNWESVAPKATVVQEAVVEPESVEVPSETKEEPPTEAVVEEPAVETPTEETPQIESLPETTNETPPAEVPPPEVLAE